MRFSVVITTCKREKSILKAAIDSVINQTYADVEIVVVNDAPAYERKKEIDELINSYGDRIQYYVNPVSRGANFARNFGAKMSKGEVLSFLDDDDYWDSNRVECVMARIAQGADIVYSDMYIVKGNRICYNKRLETSDKEMLRTMLADNFFGGFSNVSFTRKIYEAVETLDEEALSYQDQDLFIRMVLQGKVSYIPQALSYYRIMENSISLNSQKKYSGLMRLMSKYNDLYEMYPDSKRLKLESEMVYACKNGWKKEAKDIAKMLKTLESPIRVALLYGYGLMKNLLLKVVKLYEKSK